jgi:hypothetical protein
MCEIIGPYTEADSFTGYKVAKKLKIGGYASVFTYAYYEVGPVEICQNFKSPAIVVQDFYHGFTGVFTKLCMARELVRLCRKVLEADCQSGEVIVILKMTLKDSLQEAKLNSSLFSWNGVVGKEIVAIEEVERIRDNSYRHGSVVSNSTGVS